MTTKDVDLSSMWIFGYYFFTSLYYLCTSMVSIRSGWHTAILFPLTGDWKLNVLEGDEYCRDILSTLM
jgi:hypothetical protein